MFGLSAAKKYGGIYVPPHIAVIHQYMREAMAGCGKMILGSDSHTRYGAISLASLSDIVFSPLNLVYFTNHLIPKVFFLSGLTSTGT